MMALGIGGAAGVLAGCGTRGRKRPNLLFVLADQHRRQALGFMNEDPVITPALDAFAGESAVFTNALSSSPLGAPYRASLMTGRYPVSTGVTTNGVGLGKDEAALGALLKNAGYRTGFIGKWQLFDNGLGDDIAWQVGSRGQFVPPEHRFGFDYWHATNCFHCTFWRLYYEDTPEPVVDEEGWQPEHEADAAIRFIKSEAAGKRPFALFVSMVPPHNTYGGEFERHAPFPASGSPSPPTRHSTTRRRSTKSSTAT